jgi:hypothetical protein
MNSAIAQKAAATPMIGLQRLRSWVPGTSPGMTIETEHGAAIQSPP